MEERKQRIQEIEDQIAQLKEEQTKLKQLESKSFTDLRQVFAERLGAQFSAGKHKVRLISGHREDAWNAMRKLSLCSVVGDDDNYRDVRFLSDEKYAEARAFLTKLLDFYMENATNP